MRKQDPRGAFYRMRLTISPFWSSSIVEQFIHPRTSLSLSAVLLRPPPPGIVIKYESMEYRVAVHHAALVLDLASKSKKYMRELFEPPDVSASARRILGMQWDIQPWHTQKIPLVVWRTQRVQPVGNAVRVLNLTRPYIHAIEAA